MARVPGMDDLFGDMPQAGEPPLAARPAVSSAPPARTRESIRELVLAKLGELTAAERFPPWSPRDLFAARGMWPFYMDWFEKEEAEALTARFHAELTRLGQPLVNPTFEEAWEAGVFEETRAVVEDREPDPRLLRFG